MTALTKDRNTPMLGRGAHNHPVKAATTIYAGALCCLDATGWAVPGSTAVGLIAVGVASGQADNSTGADGDLAADLRPGTYRFNNSAAADEITRAEIGDDCYIVDDQTVAKTDGAGARSAAGKIVNIDDQGVWVAVGRDFGDGV